METPSLRTSERRDFLRCQQRWYWAWRMGLRAVNEDPDALWFGTGVHEALAAWYCGPGTKRGPEPAETWEKYAGDSLRYIKTTQTLDEEEEARWVDAQALGVIMLEGYRKLYGRDEQKLVIAPEKKFRLRVPWPANQNLYPTEHAPHDFQEYTPPDQGLPGDECALCDVRREEHPPAILFDYFGTFDSVWRDADTGHILLDEHKTAAQISTGHLQLDPQAGSYWAVAGRVLRDEGLIGPNEKLWGIEYNFLRKAEPDPRPRDAQGYATNIPKKADYVAALLEARAVVPPQDASGKLTNPKARAGLDLSASALTAWKMDALVRMAEHNGITVLGERSKVQPASNFLRLKVHRTSVENVRQLTRLQQEGLHMAAIRDGVLPILKNPDRSCNQGAMRCPFYEMCEFDEAGGDWRSYAKQAFVVEDPYADHRLR